MWANSDAKNPTESLDTRAYGWKLEGGYFSFNWYDGPSFPERATMDRPTSNQKTTRSKSQSDEEEIIEEEEPEEEDLWSDDSETF